jgi:hypothetical protein
MVDNILKNNFSFENIIKYFFLFLKLSHQNHHKKQKNINLIYFQTKIILKKHLK